MRTSLAVLALALCVITSACARAQESPAPATPPDLDGWAAAHNRGDLDGLVRTYTEDAVLLPPDGSVLSGHDAVRAVFAGTVASEGVRLERLARWNDGTVATEAGRWEHFTRDTHRTTSAGTYTVVWRRAGDGTWQIVQNGWSVAPSAEAEAQS
jgi:ketosteroid isomerase-like protein